jgi:hypothetical protein
LLTIDKIFQKPTTSATRADFLYQLQREEIITMTNPNQQISETCLTDCALMPESMSIDDRRQFVAGCLGHVGIREYPCTNPTAGLIKPVCHQPEVVKQQMQQQLRAQNLTGGPVDAEALFGNDDPEIVYNKA